MELNKENYRNIINSKLQIIDKIKNIDIFKNEEEYFTTVSNRLKSIESAANNLVQDSNLLKIGIVGQVKAGKSSFLNSLFFDGKDVLPKAATPMTAGLVIIQYSEKNSYEIEYYTTEDWNIIEKEHDFYQEKLEDLKVTFSDRSIEELREKIKNEYLELHTSNELFENATRDAKAQINKPTEIVCFNDYNELQKTFEKYVGASGIYTSVVKSITININDDNIKDIQIVDTPGINDPIKSRERRTEEMLRVCHGVFLLSYGGSFFSQEDYSFVQNRIGTQGISSVVVLASKYDSLLLDMARKYQGDLGGALGHISKGLDEAWKERKSNYSEIRNYEMNIVSGMAFAISKCNDQNEMNDEQKHIYSRLEKYFPQVFTDFKQGKEVLLRLSNYDTIRDKYVKDFFLKNKEDIVAKKLHSFFEHQNKVIDKEISDLKNFIDSKRHLLNSSADKFEIALNKIKATEQEFTNALDEPFKKYFEILIDQFYKISRDFGEKISSMKINSYKISRTINLEVFIKKRILWWDKTVRKDFQYLDYDTVRVRGEFEKIISKFLQDYDNSIAHTEKDKESSKVGVLKESINKKFIELLSQTLNSDLEAYFKGTLQANIDEVLKNIKSNKSYVTGINGIVKQLEHIDLRVDINGIVIINKGEIKLKEDEIQRIIEDTNIKNDKDARQKYDDLVNGVKKEVDAEMGRIEHDAEELISNLKSDFNKALISAFQKDKEKIELTKKDHETTMNSLVAVDKFLKML